MLKSRTAKQTTSVDQRCRSPSSKRSMARQSSCLHDKSLAKWKRTECYTIPTPYKHSRSVSTNVQLLAITADSLNRQRPAWPYKMSWHITRG